MYRILGWLRTVSRLLGTGHGSRSTILRVRLIAGSLNERSVDGGSIVSSAVFLPKRFVVSCPVVSSTKSDEPNYESADTAGKVSDTEQAAGLQVCSVYYPVDSHGSMLGSRPCFRSDPWCLMPELQWYRREDQEPRYQRTARDAAQRLSRSVAEILDTSFSR